MQVRIKERVAYNNHRQCKVWEASVVWRKSDVLRRKTLSQLLRKQKGQCPNIVVFFFEERIKLRFPNPEVTYFFWLIGWEIRTINTQDFKSSRFDCLDLGIFACRKDVTYLFSELVSILFHIFLEEDFIHCNCIEVRAIKMLLHEE